MKTQHTACCTDWRLQWAACSAMCRLLLLCAAPQMYDDTDPTRTGFSDIDPFYDPTDRRNDSFRDRDQFWKR